MYSAKRCQRVKMAAEIGKNTEKTASKQQETNGKVEDDKESNQMLSKKDDPEFNNVLEKKFYKVNSL